MKGGEAGASVKIATFNLYHFAEPDIWWYARDAAAPSERAPRFSAAEWAAKTAWISATLAEMDADIVGFQEVVSVEALQSLCAAAGYPNFAVAAAPRFREEAGERIYVRPIQAVASRWPMTADPVAPRPGFGPSLGLPEAWSFRRTPVRAQVEIPEIGAVVVYCCHLKSPGVAVGDAPLAGAEALAPARADLEALSRAHAFASIQRVAEASALYHDAMATVAEAPARLVAVIGDFNDAPGSPALRASTPYAAFERDGGGASEGEGGAAAESDLYRLVDAVRLSPRDPLSDTRPATHRSGAAGDVIDFVLASAAAHPWRATARFTVSAAEVHDAHFRRDDPRRTSDHAPVSATFARCAGV